MENPPDQRRVWESIADSFDRTRDRTWRHVEEYIAHIPPASRVLDLMCGNGRHAKLTSAAGHDVVCFDWARPLVAAAHERYGGGVIGDATRLPFADGAFDACTYVAGWHGIPDPAGRTASLRELRRVLRPGGTAQITVWSREAPRFAAQGTPGEPLDTIIPWRSDGHDAQRTYHLTTLPHFVQQCVDAGFAVDEEFDVAVVSQSPDNLCVTVRA